MGRIWVALDIASLTLASRLPHMVPLLHSLHQHRSPQRVLLVVGKTIMSRASILTGADHSLLTSSMQYKLSGNQCSDHKCHWIVSLMNITNETGGWLCVCVVVCVCKLWTGTILLWGGHIYCVFSCRAALFSNRFSWLVKHQHRTMPVSGVTGSPISSALILLGQKYFIFNFVDFCLLSEPLTILFKKKTCLK